MTIEIESSEPMWDWFGLSYSSYLVLPRVLLCAMPIEHQRKMVALLNEMRETFDENQIQDNYTVLLRGERGRIVRDPLAHYRHFNPANLPLRKK